MSKQDNKKSTVEVEVVETSRVVEQVNSETLSREQPSPGPATEQTTTPPGRTISSPPRVTVEPHPIVLQEQTVIPPPPPRYPDPEKLPTLEELKNGLGRDLPELKLAGHTYSEVPDQRMIIINNRIVREGQRVEGGIRLEEITWDGLILSYQGARFTMDASR